MKLLSFAILFLSFSAQSAQRLGYEVTSSSFEDIIPVGVEISFGEDYTNVLSHDGQIVSCTEDEKAAQIYGADKVITCQDSTSSAQFVFRNNMGTVELPGFFEGILK